MYLFIAEKVSIFQRPYFHDIHTWNVHELTSIHRCTIGFLGPPSTLFCITAACSHLQQNLALLKMFLKKNTDVASSLPHVQIHLLYSDRERHMWLQKYIKFPCVCVNFHPEISLFFGKSFPFLFPFIVLTTLWLMKATVRAGFKFWFIFSF